MLVVARGITSTGTSDQFQPRLRPTYSAHEIFRYDSDLALCACGVARRLSATTGLCTRLPRGMRLRLSLCYGYMHFRVPGDDGGVCPRRSNPVTAGPSLLTELGPPGGDLTGSAAIDMLTILKRLTYP
jgi:hypothetical protein